MAQIKSIKNYIATNLPYINNNGIEYVKLHEKIIYHILKSIAVIGVNCIR